MSGNGITSVASFTEVIQRLLAQARVVKPNTHIEPALVASDFGGDIGRLGTSSGGNFLANNQANYAAIETACRNIFYNLLDSTTIGDPSSSEIWNLLDIVSILSDSEQCEPGLVFWLIEELLESQTINGCRSVFDYLDSRRERITAKHFKNKHLIILRACNELLRRLSRAEDTVFCGRVFIFLFQSFPLGDRSSVNLRGEYHVENVTVFEDKPPETEVVMNDAMENGNQIDVQEDGEQTVIPQSTISNENSIKAPTEVIKDVSKAHQEKIETNTLYPMFWRLQESFSMPTRLFDSGHFRIFKEGLDATIRAFKSAHQELHTRGVSKYAEDDKRTLKRKRNESDSDFSGSFNPRYLTSRDLFDLEISDLAFQRHILVQALILVDFLLSLTPKAKKKLERSTNKSVLYNFTLGEEDAKWAIQVRAEIAAYLQQGSEGKFYYRMVDTVLSRDKNWGFWKAEACPLIERIPVSADEFLDAEKGAQKACTNRKLRAAPLGSLDLHFLSDNDNTNGLEKLKTLERYSVPTADSFKGPIAEDEFDIEMAKTEEEKQVASSARASKLWRTLRVASKNKLNLLDRIDDGNNLQALFQPDEEQSNGKKENALESNAKETLGMDIENSVDNPQSIDAGDK